MCRFGGGIEKRKRSQRTKHNCDTDNDDDTLGGVGNRLGHGVGLLDRHRRELVVACARVR